MNSVLFGSTGMAVSEVCLGTGTFGEPRWGADAGESSRIFHRYLESGGRFIDTANTYSEGAAEELLGQFAAGRRDELVIGSKYTAITRAGDHTSGGNHRKSLRQSLETTLRRLATDYVDIYWVHAWDRVTPLDELMRALDDAVTAGKILYVGVSNTPAWAIARATTVAELKGWSPFAAVQTEYSLATRTAEHELVPMAKALDLAVLAWSPLSGGLLAGGYTRTSPPTGKRHDPRSIPDRRLQVAGVVREVADDIGRTSADVALAWLRQRRQPIIPILGARTADQLSQNLDALTVSLDDATIARLDAATAPPLIMPDEFLLTEGAFEFFGGAIKVTDGA